MHIDVTAEVLLSQLGYSKNDHILTQIKGRMDNTNGFDKFSKHLISLNDKLKHMNGYVAISNSEEYFKIKCDSNDSEDILKEFHDEVLHWSDKYNVGIKKLDNKNVYYILGRSQLAYIKKASKDDIKIIKEKFIDKYSDAVTELEYRNDYELLIAIILSAQCTDKRVNIITPALFDKYPSSKIQQMQIQKM